VNGESGCKLSGTATAFFQDCKFLKNHTYGLSITDSSEVVLEKCEIRENDYDGINMSHYSMMDLRDSLVEKNGYNGILIGSKYRALLDNSEIKSNSWDGVVVENKETTFVLAGNKFESNTGHGLYFVKGKPDNLYFEFSDVDYDANIQQKLGDEETVSKLKETNTFASNGKSDVN
jgi:hypothetical protein